MADWAPRFLASRRAVLLGAATGLAAGCSRQVGWHARDITGMMPALAFRLADAATGRERRAQDFRGRVTLLMFGYTMCPDICPLTLSHLSVARDRLGGAAAGLAVLFVTVDPARDTPPLLAHFTRAFGPWLIGLRGTADQVAALARRYRAACSVEATPGGMPRVVHSSLVYAFDRAGNARLAIERMAAADADISGTAADLRRLLDARSAVA